MRANVAGIRVLLLLVLVGSSLGLSACGSDEPCSIQAEAYLHNSRSLINRVNDFFSEDNTGRAEALISDLADARDDARGFDVPSCAKDSKELMVAWLEKYVEAIEAFDAGKEFEAGELFVEVTEIEDDMYNALIAIEEDD